MSDLYMAGDVEAVRDLLEDVIARVPNEVTPIDYLKTSVERLLEGHASNHPGAVVQISNWLPGKAGFDRDRILAEPLAREEAQLTVAREHGWGSWEEAVRRVATAFDPVFESAVDAMVSGNLDQLESMLSEVSDVIERRSGFGHQATLLHYCGSNGIETWRQVVPFNLPEMVGVLVGNGADRSCKAPFYGSEVTAHDLFVTSAHPRDAGLSDIAVLLKPVE